ncbi:hypothetical protein RRF57_004469 [Xylaria bambusicola]|uniref:Meiotic recombination protein DMC1 n=1 Tax=Xylaria bambusicola TaxID=326684 RepID=A0AAN7UN53_9PEZI
MTESPRVSRSSPGPGPGPGGFLPSQALPSPTPSTASSRVAALLPRPRSKPLVPGSKKEDYARDYVARRLLHISRRYVKKFGIPDPADEVTGYENMEEVCHDLEEVVDVLWFSGTRMPTLPLSPDPLSIGFSLLTYRMSVASLQVPYLLNVALALNTYLPSFPPAPRPTFNLLRKIDHCFASLLVGYDVKTKESLPGFSSTVDNSTKMRFSKTDMVRCKSLADETRMLVAMVMSGEVDVVDYTEDDEVVQRPARAPTEARSVFVNAEDHASHSFHDVETVMNEMDDVDDFDFSSEDEGVAFSTKRKAGDISQDDVINDQAAKIKQVKIEDEDEDEGGSSVKLNDIALVNATSSRAGRESKSEDKGQTDDDDDDDDSDNDNKPSRAASTSQTPNQTIRGANLPSPPRAPALNDAERDINPNEEEEEFDEDEEDEELEMNVGKVYEKTLVQLGETLGESLIDD